MPVGQALEKDAEKVHKELREVWEKMIECPLPSELLSSLPDLSKLLFLKRNLANDSAGASQPGSDESFYAPQTETGIAILRALEQRYRYLNWKNIADKDHVLTEEQRGELVKYEREL